MRSSSWYIYSSTSTEFNCDLRFRIFNGIDWDRKQAIDLENEWKREIHSIYSYNVNVVHFFLSLSRLSIVMLNFVHTVYGSMIHVCLFLLFMWRTHSAIWTHIHMWTKKEIFKTLPIHLKLSCVCVCVCVSVFRRDSVWSMQHSKIAVRNKNTSHSRRFRPSCVQNWNQE